jgi:type II secretory pathway component PulK
MNLHAAFSRRFGQRAVECGCLPPRSTACAFVLVAVLVIVMLLSMLVISLLFRFQAEDSAASASVGGEQAWAAAMSGVEEALRVASTATPGATDWQDNPAAFRERLVFDDGTERWFFSVFAPGASPGEVRHGLTDEASKLNVNAAPAASFEKLPRVSPPMAAALIDFLDADDTPQPEGAEQEYYSALPRPYTIRNGPLASLDELLLVRGFTAEILHGSPAGSANATNAEPSAASHGSRVARGLSQFLTIASYDLNTDADGWDLTNLNDPASPLPATDRLPAAVTNFIIALQTNGVTLAHPADLLDITLPVKNAKGVVTELVSGVGKAELATVLELFTATDDYYTDGLINVNTASATVLATLPGVDEAIAETIVSARGALGPGRKTTIAWLYQEGVLDAAKFKTLAPLLTTRSAQFTFNVIGYGVPSGRFRVLEAAIDLAGGERRVTYLRDVTRRGLPFPIAAEGNGAPTQTTSRLGKEARRG